MEFMRRVMAENKSIIEESKGTVESSICKSQESMIKQEAMFADMLRKTQESTTQTI